jgi:hypothetical protein
MAKSKKTGKPKKPVANDIWPQIQAAFFCDRVLEDVGGPFSAIRIVDHLHMPSDTRIPEGAMIGVPLTMVIGFKAAGAVGDRQVQILITTPPPRGKTVQVATSVMQLSPDQVEENGTLSRLPVTPLLFAGEGVYWYTIRMTNQTKRREYTKIPLRLSLDLLPATGSPGA